ncbi:MAG: molybdenum cofactor guanylyltransferase [Acidobacteria bacterium]|nr:molybdenum cofactor guanylyltransferase [Acidobacteriota bacterium]
MGAEKAFLPFRGMTLVEHAVEILRSAGLKVTVVGNPENNTPSRLEQLTVPVLYDQPEGRGPLVALLTALKASTSLENYFLPCDLPFMEARFYEILAHYSQAHDAVVARDSAGRIHTLCAYYSKACLEVIERALRENQRKVEKIIRSSELRSLVLEARQLGIPERYFININTPEEFSRISC